MSDGEPSSWTDSEVASMTSSWTTAGEPMLFTYALGASAPTDKLKAIACDHKGVFQSVADGGSLANAMSSYYKVVAPMTSPCQVRWIEYDDINTGAPLLAACLASFDKPYSGAPNSCAEGTPTCTPEILGVSCIDMCVAAILQT
jgi:hypothetical protein